MLVKKSRYSHGIFASVILLLASVSLATPSYAGVSWFSSTEYRIRYNAQMGVYVVPDFACKVVRGRAQLASGANHPGPAILRLDGVQFKKFAGPPYNFEIPIDKLNDGLPHTVEAVGTTYKPFSEDWTRNGKFLPNWGAAASATFMLEKVQKRSTAEEIERIKRDLAPADKSKVADMPEMPRPSNPERDALIEKILGNIEPLASTPQPATPTSKSRSLDVGAAKAEAEAEAEASARARVNLPDSSFQVQALPKLTPPPAPKRLTTRVLILQPMSVATIVIAGEIKAVTVGKSGKLLLHGLPDANIEVYVGVKARQKVEKIDVRPTRVISASDPQPTINLTNVG